MADSPLNTGATQKTAQDWVRQLRFSSAVNKSTLGVDTDRVTPQLMLASSKKLLGISKGEQQGDMKDSLQYQKIYGPVEYFAQRIQKDGGNVARTMLWKATNKGNLDFIGSGSLQPHISAVFNQSGLSQFIDNTTPLQGIDTSMKVTRVGEGGIPTQEVAPIQMRLVQPSYYGYVDGVRTAEKCYLPDTEIYTTDGWKNITDLTLNDKLAVLIDGRPDWSNPLQLQRYDHDGLIFAFQNKHINFAVTPGHRMYVSRKNYEHFNIHTIDQVYGTSIQVMCGCDKPSVVDETKEQLAILGSDKSNILKADIVHLAEQLGQVLLDLYEPYAFIPQWLFTAPTKARWVFVQAVLRSAGHKRHFSTTSKKLAEDFARLLFVLGQSVSVSKHHKKSSHGQALYKVVWHKNLTHTLTAVNAPHSSTKAAKGYHTFHYTGKVYCPTVPGGLVYVRRGNDSKGFWCGNSPGITGYLTKNVLKGTDGKLYQKFLNAKTGKQQYVDSQTAAASIVTTNQYIDSKDKFVYALGGPRGVRIVQRSKIDYILPRSDQAYSTAANYVPMLSGIKSMRLLMGCHHPQTPILIVDKNGFTDIIPAKRVGHLQQAYMFGCDDKGQDALYDLQNVVPRIPQKNSKFKKVTLQSGRILPTSAQHKWYIYTQKGFKQIPAKDLKQGMLVPRSLFASLPVRTTTIMGKPMSKQICTMLGRLIRTLKTSAYNYKFTIVVDKQAGIDQRRDIQDAFEQLGVLKYNIFKTHGIYSVSLKDPVFIDWIDQNIGNSPQALHIPSCLLSLPKGFTSQFLDSYYKDLTNVGEDDQGSSWLLDFPNAFIRDGISLMLNKIFTDTQYRDTKINTKLARALKLVPMKTTMGDVVLQKIVSIEDVKAPAIMIDIDCGDNVYAAGNGIITHNSKYGAQAVPLQQREAPWVRSLDEATGMDMPTKIGKMMGTQWAPKSGMIKAVRDDRIDILYDDGTTGSVGLYKNFPANAKGWITNYPKVKAGDKVTKGQLLASSNYTDDNGVMATGRNLRVGYLSFKGGTYEDGCAISQSAAKKMGYTTMYKTAMDKDKSIRTAKSLYNTWKPGKYTKEQLQNLDDDGIVKVGSIINKGDPMILGIRTTEPSPGTLGKRLLTDVTEVWQHAHPGTVTDVVNTKNGIRVYATVSSPLKEGDKISAPYGNKATCYDSTTYVFTDSGWKLFKDLTDSDKVATLGADGTAHFQTPSDRQVFDYEGQMLGYRNRFVAFCVTPDHKMWCKPDFEYYRHPQRPFKRVEAQQMYNRDFVHVVAADFPDGNQPQFFQVQPQQHTNNPSYVVQNKWKTQDMAAFLGIYLSQGNLNNQYHIKISQKRDLTDPLSGLRCDRIEALLTRMGFHYTYNQKCYVISNKSLYKYLQRFGKSIDKYVPQEVFGWSHRLQQIFLDWFYMGDGQKVFGSDSTVSGRIRVISKRLIEDLQRLYILNGYHATVKEYKDRVRTYKGVSKVYSRLYGVSFYKQTFRTTFSPASSKQGKKYQGYYKVPYKGKVYCCTVSTGVILVQKDGCPMWCGNCSQVIPDEQMPRDEKGRPLQLLFDPLGIISRTNPSQLMEVGLGKVAQKIGKPIVMPQFMPKGQSRLKYVKELMKKHNVPWKQTVYDPGTNRHIKNVYTGNMYFMPLKHISDTKMSARGTGSYTAQGIPASGGPQGCFPAAQNVMTIHGQRSIARICQKKLKQYVLTWDKQTSQWCYRQITDWFTYRAKVQNILNISTDIDGVTQHSYPTKNHKMYLADGSIKLAGQLSVGDLLACHTQTGTAYAQIKSITPYKHDKPGVDQIPVYDFTVDKTHNYCLSGGINVSNSKRIGALETSALVGHNAFDFLVNDAKLIRGQSNAEFWRSIRTGQIPVMPGEPLVHKKFFAHLQGSGMNVQKHQKGVSIFALSNKDVQQLAGNRELKSTDTYQQKSFRAIDGGLFGKDVFGQEGKNWGFIKLDQPLPNPVMQEPLARLLNMTDQDFQAVVQGRKEVNGLKSSKDIQQRLSKYDMKKQKLQALQQLKQASPSRRDAALKRYVAIARMQDQGVQPSQYMLDRIPVLPPQFRPITSHGGLTMVADSNYLYAQLLNARNDAREAQNLPDEYKQEAQANIYRKWKELVGLYDPSDVKLKSKNVKGLLKWALGKSPKLSAFNVKVLGSTVDTVGRGVVVPSTKIALDEIGMPIQMAWDVYSPFIVRKLVQQNYTPVQAMQLVKDKAQIAKDALVEAVAQRPVVMNRAPSLHKLSLMGFNVKLTNGHAIKVNPSIVVPFNMDFDGDSISNTVAIAVTTETANSIFSKAVNRNLTNSEKELGYQYQPNNQKGTDMIKDSDRIQLHAITCTLADIPVKEGSEVKKSDTVTEWDVDGNVYVSTVDPATGEHVIAPMTKVSKHTGLKMYDCTLAISSAYSHVVTASEDHSLITLNPTTLELEKTRPEDAKGRCVPMMRHNHMNAPEHCLKRIKLDKDYPLSYKMGMFLGMMIGDGWVDSQYATYIACADQSLQHYITDLCVENEALPFTKTAKLFSFAPSEGRFSQKDYERITIYITTQDACELSHKIGRGAENKRIPMESLCGSKRHMLGVLCGLLATDGHIGVSSTASKKASIKNIAYHTISTTLRDNIQELCLKLGVKTRVTPYKGKNSKSTCYEVGFCLEDVARLKKENPLYFTIPVEYKEKALCDICADIEKGVKNSFDIVPFPRGLFCEFSWAELSKLNKGTLIPARAKGYIKRSTAKKFAEHLKLQDWSTYKTPTYLKEADRTNRSPEEAEKLVSRWIAIVEDESTGWEIVEDVVESSCTEGWDCTVPGPYTFTLSTGTVVQDTVNLHVPVSRGAVRNVRQNMMPSKNLISMRKNKILYKPQKAYTQGIYVASRMDQTKDVKAFNSLAQAKQAFHKGVIDVDTPIVIKK